MDMEKDDGQWAKAVLERAMKRLRAKGAAAGRLEEFDLLKPYLYAIETAAPSYAEAAAKLDQTEAAVRQLVHRLRRKLRALLRDEIAHTNHDQQRAKALLEMVTRRLRMEWNAAREPEQRFRFPRIALPDPAAALEQLCRKYWEPLYAYLRRRGYEMQAAQDLIESFFASLRERTDLEVPDSERSRLRVFLLGSLERLLASEQAKTKAEMRGREEIIFPLEVELAEKHYQQDSSGNLTAAQHFDRRWALTVLDRTIARLSGEVQAQGKEEQFEALKPFLSVESGEVDYEKVSERLQMTADAVQQEVLRWRHRLSVLVRAEIAYTVGGPAEIEDELRYLINLLRP